MDRPGRRLERTRKIVKNRGGRKRKKLNIREATENRQNIRIEWKKMSRSLRWRLVGRFKRFQCGLRRLVRDDIGPTRRRVERYRAAR